MKKILVRVLLVVLVAALGFGGFVYYMVHNSTSQIYSYNKKTNKSSDDKTTSKNPLHTYYSVPTPVSSAAPTKAAPIP